MISMDKKYQTRDGRKVRIYAVDGGFRPVHGAINQPGLGWEATVWNKDGKPTHCHMSPDHDLIEVKPKQTRTYWIVHFKARAGDVFTHEHHARAHAESCAPNVVAITGPHTVEFTEGEGL